MNQKGVTKNDLIAWIQKSVQSENFENYKIVNIEASEKGNGYLGDIVFASITGTTKEHESKEISFVIKHGKINDYLRSLLPIRSAFETEIHFYKTIMPAFHAFQVERNIKDVFNSMPKCYKSFVTDKMEVLVLDNLIKTGYQLYDRTKPLNLNHQKIILREYGKLHALSFGLRDQHPELFNALVPSTDVLANYMSAKCTQIGYEKTIKDAIDIFREKRDFALADKLKGIFVKSPCELLLDLYKMDSMETAIIHGDCWNNNFMYKYENNNQESPSKVMILDWQMSALRSPVFDLSYFIYITSSKEGIKKFDELMEVYYNSFSDFLKKLGSNPEKLFPFEVLKTHWKKYSLCGMIYAHMLLKFILCDKEDAPELANVADDKNINDFFNINVKHKDLYYERLKLAVSHYFNSNL